MLFRDNIQVDSHPNHPRESMRTATTYRAFRTAKRQEIIDITDDVEHCRNAAGIVAEVIVPVTDGALDLGPWQRVFYGEWDEQRPKRVLSKALGV